MKWQFCCEINHLGMYQICKFCVGEEIIVAKHDVALVMLEKIPGTNSVTVGGDKGFDRRGFVAECRNLGVVPHVAQNLGRNGGSAIDGRTTRQLGYAISQNEEEADRRMLIQNDVLGTLICRCYCSLAYTAYFPCNLLSASFSAVASASAAFTFTSGSTPVPSQLVFEMGLTTLMSGTRIMK